MTTLTLSESTCAELRAALCPKSFQELLPDVTEADIVKAVCASYGIHENWLRNRNRTRLVSEARFVVWALLTDFLHLSQCEIGRKFARDHGSISNGIAKVKNLREVDKQFRERFHEIKAALKATKTGG